MTVKNIGFINQAANYAGNIVSVPEGKETPEKTMQKLIDLSGKLIAQEPVVQEAAKTEENKNIGENIRSSTTTELLDYAEESFKQLDSMGRLSLSDKWNMNVRSIYRAQLNLVIMTLDEKAQKEGEKLISNLYEKDNFDKLLKIVTKIYNPGNPPSAAVIRTCNEFLEKLNQKMLQVSSSVYKGQYKDISNTELSSILENRFAYIDLIKSVHKHSPDLYKLTAVDTIVMSLDPVVLELKKRAAENPVALYAELNGKDKKIYKVLQNILKIQEKEFENCISTKKYSIDFARELSGGVKNLAVDKINRHEEEISKAEKEKEENILKKLELQKAGKYKEAEDVDKIIGTLGQFIEFKKGQSKQNAFNAGIDYGYYVGVVLRETFDYFLSDKKFRIPEDIITLKITGNVGATASTGTKDDPNKVSALSGVAFELNVAKLVNYGIDKHRIKKFEDFLNSINMVKYSISSPYLYNAEELKKGFETGFKDGTASLEKMKP